MLGLSVGGGRGMGCKGARGCRRADPLAGGEDTEDKGERVDEEKVEGNPTEAISSKALVKTGIESKAGDGGGDGVVEVERKVGPRGVDAVAVDVPEAGDERKRSCCVRSSG